MSLDMTIRYFEYRLPRGDYQSATRNIEKRLCELNLEGVVTANSQGGISFTPTHSYRDLVFNVFWRDGFDEHYELLVAVRGINKMRIEKEYGQLVERLKDLIIAEAMKSKKVT